MSAIKQIEFAELLGVSRSYITKLKADGRLVMAGNLVDVEASRAQIIGTTGAGREDVAERWAKARSDKVLVPPVEDVEEQDDIDEDESIKTDSPFPSKALSAAKKEYFAAAQMQTDYLKSVGELIERSAVAAAVEDVMTTVRQSLEQQPHRVAPMLVGQDLDYIRATLKQEINGVLTEMVKDFCKRLQQLAGEEE